MHIQRSRCYDDREISDNLSRLHQCKSLKIGDSSTGYGSRPETLTARTSIVIASRAFVLIKLAYLRYLMLTDKKDGMMFHLDPSNSGN